MRLLFVAGGAILHLLGFGYFLGRWRDPHWGSREENEFSAFCETAGISHEPIWCCALLWEACLPLWLLWSIGRLAMRAGERMREKKVQAQAQARQDREAGSTRTASCPGRHLADGPVLRRK